MASLELAGAGLLEALGRAAVGLHLGHREPGRIAAQARRRQPPPSLKWTSWRPSRPACAPRASSPRASASASPSASAFLAAAGFFAAGFLAAGFSAPLARRRRPRARARAPAPPPARAAGSSFAFDARLLVGDAVAARVLAAGRRRGGLGLGLLGSARRPGAEHHRHVAAVLLGPLLDDGELAELLREAVEDDLAALGVRDLAAAEHDRDLDLVARLQEALDVALLGRVVVLRDLRAELDLADRRSAAGACGPPSGAGSARTCTSSSPGSGRRAAWRQERPRRGRDPALARCGAPRPSSRCPPAARPVRSDGPRARGCAR